MSANIKFDIKIREMNLENKESACYLLTQRKWLWFLSLKENHTTPEALDLRR